MRTAPTWLSWALGFGCSEPVRFDHHFHSLHPTASSRLSLLAWPLFLPSSFLSGSKELSGLQLRLAM